jgi:hypothetical protein
VADLHVDINLSSSAKATMSSKTRSMLFFESPRIDPFMKMFSRPVSSGWNPAPNSRRAASRPRVTISPSVGWMMPATHFSSVDFPEPLWPSRPTVEPSSIAKSSPSWLRAQKSSNGIRPQLITRSFSEL